ncbi:hypothetical protein CAPTEDRAFT_202791 [Capitella teleta]|uniref:Uncharacterized protein n=1 Tax=Capitella teleta TaxID=283909 RepID=R7UZ09_CAPTE|nr:hypothetical protein CAPTEDRAFT_202791 [Capitella teleta]|eukprot:ELU09177.1 hypothetical protein CAPTEDRAFT_202791 [Capitella teleta]
MAQMMRNSWIRLVRQKAGRVEMKGRTVPGFLHPGAGYMLWCEFGNELGGSNCLICSCKPSPQYILNKIHNERLKRRPPEKKFKKTELQVHFEMWKDQCTKVVRLIDKKKKAYFQNKPNGASSKEAFTLIDRLLAKDKTMIDYTLERAQRPGGGVLVLLLAENCCNPC